MIHHPAANIFPLMTEESFAGLKADIQANGQIEPIWLYRDVILDGRNRYKACTELGIEPKFQAYEGNSPTAFVVSVNLERRHLTSTQRACVAVDILPGLEAEAKERQGSREDIVPKMAPSDKGKSRDKAATKLKVSHGYVSDAKKIKAESPEQFEQMRSGEKTMVEVKSEQLREHKQERIETLRSRETKPAEGVYDVIVIDPPWPMAKIEREVRPNQVVFDYPVMSESEISAIELPTADDCHVWVWATHKFLPMALRCLDVWGLKYVCTFVWHKPGGFQPFGLPQYNCEFVLYARKGTPIFADTKAFNTAFDAPRGGHSEKPIEFYEVIARVTAGRRLDMFNRREIPFFDGWGSESGNRLAG